MFSRAFKRDRIRCWYKLNKKITTTTNPDSEMSQGFFCVKK